MARPVRIAYHNPSVIRTDRWAGERGRQLIDALVRHGADVRAIPTPPAASPEAAPHRRIAHAVRTRLPRSFRSPLVRLRLLQRGTSNSVRWGWRLWRALRNDLPDVLLARFHEFEWTPLVVARLLRLPLVLEVHSAFGLEKTLTGARPSRLAARMDKAFFRRADIVWVHTPALREIVIGHVDDPGKIRLIPFGVEDPGVRSDPGSAAGTIEIVFAGSFYPWHGIEELLAAFAGIAGTGGDRHLTLIGDGLTLPDARAAARRLGIENAVSFPGWLDRKQLFERLERSHIGVAPYVETRHNYFEPVKILDYQMAGLPIIASAVGHIPAMVDDGAGGLLVPPGDVAALATALQKLIDDPDLRRRLGEGARQAAGSIDDTAAAVVEVCRALAGR